jgi:MoaA/NifB/PqqE/SkfB family radical SAM enzyme
MPFKYAERLVKESGSFDDFTSLAFTAGEPLLFLDDVVHLASIASSYGKSTTVATAAHWADTPQETERYVNRLVLAGLNRLNVSHDAAHAEFVPATNIMNVVDCIKNIEFHCILYLQNMTMPMRCSGILTDQSRVSSI